MMEIEKGSTRKPSLENSLWKKLWVCRIRLRGGSGGGGGGDDSDDDDDDDDDDEWQPAFLSIIT
jgi:hypothetical protein